MARLSVKLFCRMPSALAQALGATLVLVRVIRLVPVYSDQMTGNAYVVQEILDENETEAKKYLTRIANALTLASPAVPGTPGLQIKTCTRIGSPVDVILEEGKAAGAQLIAMTTHGRTGLRQLIMGNVAHEVLWRGSLPLLLLRPGDAAS